jgi:benzoate transport
MSVDPREVINQSKMSVFQMAVIAVTVALNSLDGFDILSIGIASPGIAKEWGLDKSTQGLILMMELIGMGLGSFFLGKIADRFGRRPTILSCMVIMVVGMFMVTTTHGVVGLSIWRIVTGIGIGGLLAAITALTVEFSSLRRRHLCISLMAIGYPIGGVVGGLIVSRLLLYYDWRSVFYLGTFLTAIFIPLFYFVVPESVHWLMRKQPVGVLDKINRTMKKLGHDSIMVLPQMSGKVQEKAESIFSSRLLRTTLILTFTYILHITTYYFILKWATQIGVDLGFPHASAVKVLVWANVGGALGGTIFGLLTLKFDLKKLAVGVLFFSAVSIAIFGYSPADLFKLSMLGMMTGFFGNVGIIALYALVAHSYPTHARAFGTGFMLAMGRGGAILSPILVGSLLQRHITLPSVGLIMSVGSLVGAVVLLFLKLEAGDIPVPSDTTEKREEAAASSSA